jgi:hypothetical protein
MRDQIKSMFESIVIFAIVLVLVQTFLEDFASLMAWNWNIRKVLIISGFAFDAFFTIEFIARFYTAVYHGQGAEYFIRKRGWIDFIASIPLLLFSSGPALLAVISGGTIAFAVGSILNVLKVIKAIKIARVLRLLRVLKIFKQIKYTDSVMAQRHIAKITTLIISLFVFVVLFATIASDSIGIPSYDDVTSSKFNAVIESVTEYGSDATKAGEELTRLAAEYDELLIAKLHGETLYSRFTNNEYTANYGPDDYWYLEREDFEFYFDNIVTVKMRARDNLIYFIMIILLVILLLVYYSPHFALTITDPIHVMRRGMDDASYNFEVKIAERYKDDDIFRLAQAYNSEYLPLKDRSQQDSEPSNSLLDFDDVKNLLEEE